VWKDYVSNTSAAGNVSTVDINNTHNSYLDASPKKLPGSALLPPLFSSNEPEIPRYSRDDYLPADVCCFPPLCKLYLIIYLLNGLMTSHFTQVSTYYTHGSF